MTDKNSLSKKCLKLFFKTPVYNFLINKNISTDVHNILSDPWGGDINSGYNILRGYIKFFNETINFSNSVWEKNDASKVWKEELHSFEWANDLRAVGTNESRVFLRQSITEWINNWKKNGWKTSNKKEVKNIELWKELDSLVENFNIKWSWVKGHSTDQLNNEVDLMAKKAASLN